MEVSLDKIKELRELTSCSISDCKKALEEAKGEVNKAQELLLKRGVEMAAKKAGREAKEGRVDSYVHMGNKIGVVIEVNCETDFVARNEDFCRFTKDVAMHIAAMAPQYISDKHIPPEVLEIQKNKDLFIKETCLLNQPFVKDSSKTIQNYLSGLVAKMGENIFIGRFIRYKVGEVEQKANI